MIEFVNILRDFKALAPFVGDDSVELPNPVLLGFVGALVVGHVYLIVVKPSDGFAGGALQHPGGLDKACNGCECGDGEPGSVDGHQSGHGG